MKFDILDMFILNSIWDAAAEERETTTWEIAKKYHWEDKPDKFENTHVSDRFYTTKTALIANRITSLAKSNLIKIQKNGRKKSFVLLSDNVGKKIMKFSDGKRGMTIQIKFKDKWAIFQL